VNDLMHLTLALLSVGVLAIAGAYVWYRALHRTGVQDVMSAQQPAVPLLSAVRLLSGEAEIAAAVAIAAESERQLAKRVSQRYGHYQPLAPAGS